MKTLATLFLFSLVGLLPASASASGVLEAHAPWVREAPPMASVMAGYMSLHNHSNQTYSVERVSSTQFARVEIHRSEMKNGIASMIPVSRMFLSAQGSILFAPGGLHLMLIEPKTPLRSGDNVQLTFHFSNGKTLDIQAPVKKAADMEDHSGHEMNGNMSDQHGHDQHR